VNEGLKESEVRDIRHQFLIKLKVSLLFVNFLVQVNRFNWHAFVDVSSDSIDYCGLVVALDLTSRVVVSLRCRLLPTERPERREVRFPKNSLVLLDHRFGRACNKEISLNLTSEGNIAECCTAEGTRATSVVS
jgi:hypothetical protein